MATGFRQLERMTAVVGYDPPYLKKADVGFAMGIMGREVDKEAAGLVLLDDSFKSVVAAAKWGRNFFYCIRKFLQFYLTANFVAIVMILAGCIVLG